MMNSNKNVCTGESNGLERSNINRMLKTNSCSRRISSFLWYRNSLQLNSHWLVKMYSINGYLMISCKRNTQQECHVLLLCLNYRETKNLPLHCISCNFLTDLRNCLRQTITWHFDFPASRLKFIRHVSAEVTILCNSANFITTTTSYYYLQHYI